MFFTTDLLREIRIFSFLYVFLSAKPPQLYFLKHSFSKQPFLPFSFKFLNSKGTVNPLIGREMEGTDIVPAAKKKKVLVAGGTKKGKSFSAWRLDYV